MKGSRDQWMPEPVCGVGAEGSLLTCVLSRLRADGRRDLTLSTSGAGLWARPSRAGQGPCAMGSVQITALWPQPRTSAPFEQDRSPVGAANSDYGRKPVAMRVGGSALSN
jgi:hypothetical protein